MSNNKILKEDLKRLAVTLSAVIVVIAGLVFINEKIGFLNQAHNFLPAPGSTPVIEPQAISEELSE